MPRRPGPAPLRADIIELRGNRSKLTEEELAARRALEVRARPLRPTAPPDLSSHARECWQMLAPELEALGLLSVLDGPGFRLACETYALALYALEEMRAKKADETVDARKKSLAVLEVDRVHGGQRRKTPAFAVYAQASREFRAWCVEFGLTPSARVSLRPGAHGAPEGSGREDDDAFFGT